MNGISIIIPIFNEASNLPGLLEAIMAQTLKPDEVIFVDSGSTDKTDQILTKFSNGSIFIRHIKNLGGMPGGNRNKGILESKYDWIAFIDAGIIPSNNWLEELMRCVKNNNARSIFGKCQFTGTTSFSHAVCAVSYGCTSHPVIPASIFHKDIFKVVGLFPENLRAGEDTVWLKSFDRTYTSRISTNIIVARYDSFPKSIYALIKKYHVYEISLIRAGLGKIKTLILTVYFLTLIVMVTLNSYPAFIFLSTYLVLRGGLDPIRRSGSLIWWRKHPVSISIAPISASIIDMTIVITRISANARAIKNLFINR
jgi:glycosyltransferase involved in cell wall biosynthesis